ncbi:MAG TPA: hypothetical protein VHV51_21630 [Polyangiaceae bacterium]|nr:hypothetical protein [Polyangiaceae bacterium]
MRRKLAVMRRKLAVMRRKHGARREFDVTRRAGAPQTKENEARAFQQAPRFQ